MNQHSPAPVRLSPGAMVLACLLGVAGAAQTWPADAHAQAPDPVEDPPPYSTQDPDGPLPPAPWRSWVDLDFGLFNSVDPDWTRWTTLTGAVQRRFDRGSVTVEGIRSTRFGEIDTGVGVDTYVDFGDRSYANLQGRWFPNATVRPETDARVEIFHGVGDAWEASAAYRRITTELQAVGVMGASIARYLPGWYVRGRVDVNRSDAGTSPFFSVLGRRFIEEIDGMVEGVLGAGEEVVDVATGPVLDVRRSHVIAVRAEAFPTARVGGSAGLSYGEIEGVPPRLGVSAAVIVRW